MENTTPDLSQLNWLDNSKCGAYETCPRLYFLRYVLHLTSSDGISPALVFGKAFHKGVEVFLNSKDEEAAQAAALATLEAERLQVEEGDDWRLEPDSLLRALNYFLSTTGQELLSLAVEVKPEAHLWFHDETTGFTYVGKADVLLHSKSGTWNIFDVKTTGWSINAGWGQKLLVDTQIQTYALLAEKHLGVEIFGGGYAIVSAARSRLRDGRWSPNMRLDSALLPIALTQSHKDRAIFRLRSVAREVSEDTSFKCVFSSCLQWNRVCSFHPLCERTWELKLPELQDEVLSLALNIGFRQEAWNPFEL